MAKFTPEPQLTVQDSVLLAMWDKFLSDPEQRSVVQQAALEYPEGGKSVTFHFRTIEAYSSDLADYLLNKPRHALQTGAMQLQHVDVTVTPRPRLHLRVDALPSTEVKKVQDIRAEHLGKLIAFRGDVVSMTEAYAQVLEACFDCRTCGNRIRLVQDDEYVAEPVICDGCEKPGPWTLREEECRFIDHQVIEVHELGRPVHERIRVHLQDDLVHRAPPGTVLTVNGILTAQKRQHGHRVYVAFGKTIQAVSLKVEKTA